MKCLHVIPYMHPAAGGPPVVVERFCAHTPALGWEAKVISTSLLCGDDGARLQRDLRRRLDVTLLPVDRPTLLGLSSRAAAAIAEAVACVDMVHVHTLWSPLGTMARRACQALRRPYVLMPHGMLDPYALGIKAWRKTLYLRLREAANLRAAAALVFTTRLEEERARQSLAWLPRGQVVALGADAAPADSKHVRRDRFMAAYPQARGRQVVLFLGRIHPKKGIERILAAMPAVAAKHPEVLLVIAGNGDADYVAGLHAKVDRSGLRGHTLFTGPLVNAAKWDAFACACLFLLPSHQENFALAVAEAMHMAVPVVVSDRVDIWPYIAREGAGLVVEDEAMPQGLECAILQLLRDPACARRMGENGRTLAQADFTWERAAANMVAVYKGVLEHAG